MSNSNDSDKSKSKAHKSPSPEADNETAPSKTKRWSFIQNDLEKALVTWQELEKNRVTLSPDEEQFEKIRAIIGQLKSKLEQF